MAMNGNTTLADAIAGAGTTVPEALAGSETLAPEAIAGSGTTVPDVGTQSTPIGGLAAAGVDLAKLTMGIMVGAIIVLMLMLNGAELGQRHIADDAITQQLAMIVANPAQPPDRRLPSVAAALRGAAADSAVILSPADAADARALIELSLRNPAITPAQRTTLEGRCVPLPPATTADRAAQLQSCATTLEALMTDSGSLGQRVAFMQAVQKSLSDDRAAHRAFWLQVTQLVLINLLLPILTALLGYIFGTQQAQR